MEIPSFRKIILSLILFSGFSFSVSAQQLNEFYTVQEAQQCFHSQALPTCEETINQCLMKKECEKELHFYHECTFQKEYTNQIFNGNCFKDWKKTAIASKQVINCIDSNCNLAGYNSQVSIKILYTCTSEALVEYNLQCDEQCQEILKEKISNKIQYQPINKIYGSLKKEDMKNNQNVQKLIQVIKKQCIDENGSIKKRHEEDSLKKKLNKQRMIDRMNQKNKDQAYLKQYQTSNGSKPVTEDL